MTVEIGGGSTSNICSISPSDMAGSIDNIMERLETLENIVSQLLGYDVTTNQLSDLSPDLGWITNVTYMGIPGWTQTPSGTLIPPPGFSLSGSGLFNMYNACTGEVTDYQGVVMDSDGVLQFGFTPQGELCGEKVEAWNDAAAAAGPLDYAISRRKTGSLYQSSRGITITASPPLSEGSAILTVAEAGVYMVSALVNSGSSPIAVGTLSISVPDTDQNFGDIHSSSTTTWHASGLVNVTAGQAITILFDFTGVVTESVTHFGVSAIRVTSTA